MYPTQELERLASLGVYLYQTHQLLDLVMLQWLEQMRRDGDLEHTLSAGVRTPFQFLQFINNRILLYRVDTFSNVTHALWLEPCMGSVFLSYYVRPEARVDHKSELLFLYDCIDAVFAAGDVNTICGFIQHRQTDDETRRFIRLHERLGYTYSGRVEKFFDGRDCHVVAMTREAWEANDGRFKRAWRRARSASESEQPNAHVARIGDGQLNRAGTAGSNDAWDIGKQASNGSHAGPVIDGGWRL